MTDFTFIGYQVVECFYAHKKEEWQDEIINLLKQGWRLHGVAILPKEEGPYMYYAQAMVLPESPLDGAI